MGRAYADGLNESVEQGLIDIDMALRVHLAVNFYPPIPAKFVPAAKQAIEAYPDTETMIEMPETRGGCTWYESTRNLINALQLHAFLSEDDEEE